MSDRVDVKQSAPRGMIQLRADIADPAVRAAISDVVGLGVPGQRERVAEADRAIVWMSPDELLIVCDYGSVDELVDALNNALSPIHHLCVNVSDARAVFTLTGRGWRDVLAKGMPVDFRASSFGPGQVRRSRLGQVAAAIWMTGDDEVELVCFRSVADFVGQWLQTAALEGSLPEMF